MTVIYTHQNQTEVITMTNERKITNEEIKALAEKYSLAAADIEKGIEGLEAEDIFLSADYIEDMIINGDLLPLTITLNLEKATYSDTDAMYPVECDRPEELKKHICNIGYSTTAAQAHRNEAYKPSLEEIKKCSVFASETDEDEIGIYLDINTNLDLIFIGYFKGIRFTDSEKVLSLFKEWLEKNRP